MRLLKVLATLVCTFLLQPDGVSTFISFGGCGCVFLAVVKGFVKSKLLFSLVQCFVSLVLKCPSGERAIQYDYVHTYIYMLICPFSYFYKFLSA